MNPFLLSPRQRLADWKTLRTGLAVLSEEAQLDTVAKYWSMAPLSTMAYDPERLDLCPTPWEMIMEGDWCSNSVAIGMEFTLRLAGWPPDRLTIRMVKDYDISDQKLIVEIDDKIWINYDYGIAVLRPTTRHDILSTWRFGSRQYEIVVA